MIAIPIDNMNPGTKSSKLFGNVDYFALYDPDAKAFDFIKNEASGDGVKTAELLNAYKASRVFYSYMGNGPFSSLQDNNIEVYYLGKEPLELDQIIKLYDKEVFTRVTKDNAKTFLDPGTQTGGCQCGCD